MGSPDTVARVRSAPAPESLAIQEDAKQHMRPTRNKTWPSKDCTTLEPTSDRPRLTYTTLIVLGSMNLVDCIAMNLLTPYAEEMVSQLLNEPKSDPSVLSNVAALIGIYNLAEMIFSPIWGVLSDYVGRRSTLLIGYAGTCVMPLFFGTASSLRAAFIARFLSGFFSGNVNVTKTCLGELVDESNEARAFGMLGFCYGLGMVIGPILGGSLVHPERISNIFANTIFQKFPYLLPNLVYSILSACAWLLGVCCLPETLPKGRRKSLCRKKSAVSSRSLNADAVKSRQCYPPKLICMMLAYGLVVACMIFTTQSIIMVLQLPRDIDGFALTPFELGALQNFAAAGLLTMQLLFFPYLTKTIGYRACIILGFVSVCCVFLPFPFYGLLADPAKFGLWRFAPLAFMMFVQQAGYELCLPTTIIWVNRYAVGRDRGMVNGLANSWAALLRAVAPSAVSCTLNLGLSTGTYLGHYLPVPTFFVVALVTVSLAAPALPRAAPKGEAQSQDSKKEGPVDLEQACVRSPEDGNVFSELCEQAASLQAPALSDPNAYFVNELAPPAAELEEA